MAIRNEPLFDPELDGADLAMLYATGALSAEQRAAVEQMALDNVALATGIALYSSYRVIAHTDEGKISPG